MNIHGVFLHVMGDALGSVAVIISALVMAFWDHPMRYLADPISSILITCLIIYTTIPLIKESAAVLLEEVPESVDLTQLRNDLLAVPFVCDIHELHAWGLNPSKMLCALHVTLGDSCNFCEVRLSSVVVLFCLSLLDASLFIPSLSDCISLSAAFFSSSMHTSSLSPHHPHSPPPPRPLFLVFGLLCLHQIRINDSPLLFLLFLPCSFFLCEQSTTHSMQSNTIKHDNTNAHTGVRSDEADSAFLWHSQLVHPARVRDTQRRTIGNCRLFRIICRKTQNADACWLLLFVLCCLFCGCYLIFFFLLGDCVGFCSDIHQCLPGAYLH